MPKFVRVRLENGAHKTLPESAPGVAKLPRLKSPAFTRDGRPAPTKPRVRLRRGSSQPTTHREAVDASES